MYTEHPIFQSIESQELAPLLNPFWLLQEIELASEETQEILYKLLALYCLHQETAEVEGENEFLDTTESPVVRIILASINPRKKKGIEAFQAHFNSIYKNAKIREVIPVRVPGEEPDAANAIAVSRHKVKSLIQSLLEDPETSSLSSVLNHRSLIIASDVVVKVRPVISDENGEGDSLGESKHLLNLSRITDREDKVNIESFVQYLTEQYSRGSFELTYDIANSATMVMAKTNPEGREEYAVSPTIRDSAVRIHVRFSALPEELIKEQFSQLQLTEATEQQLRDGGVDPSINVGLPLFDQGSKFLDFVTHVSVQPLVEDQILSKMSDRDSASARAPFVEVANLSLEQKTAVFNSLQHWITYGVVPSAAELITARPT